MICNPQWQKLKVELAKLEDCGHAIYERPLIVMAVAHAQQACMSEYYLLCCQSCTYFVLVAKSASCLYWLPHTTALVWQSTSLSTVMGGGGRSDTNRLST